MEIITTTHIHIVFLHDTFRRRNEDRYLLDMACAMQEEGHTVSVYVSELHPSTAFPELADFNLHYCGWWLPSTWKHTRSILMALRLLLFPPAPAPSMVVMDIATIGLYLLSMLSGVRVIYLHHFTGMESTTMDVNAERSLSRLDRIHKSALEHADEIIVASDCLADIFRRYFPTVDKETRIIHPCIDTGPWTQRPPISINRLVPDLPKPAFIFVTFGTYTKRSNFKLVLQAFEDLLVMSVEALRSNLHLIIAGTPMDGVKYPRAASNYGQLIDETKTKSFASQVTFLRRVDEAQRRTLMEAAICMVVASKCDPFPHTVLAALAYGTPIIAVKGNSFAKEVLRHRITAIMVEPQPARLATSMCKMLTNPNIQVYLGNMGREHFAQYYSYAAFKRKVNGIVRHYAEVQLPGMYMDKLQLNSI